MPVKDLPYLRSEDLLARIAARYPEPAWIVLYEVRDGTGFSTAGRRADALALGVWPSRGLQIVGFEVKVSRTDWQRELARPAKAESIARQCDEWWVVSANGAVDGGDVPKGWGWLEADAKGLALRKAHPAKKPAKLEREFLMSVVRSVSRSYVPKSQVHARAEARAEELAALRSTDNRYALEQAKELAGKVEQFEAASGLKISEGWNKPKEVGALVKLALDGQLVHEIRTIARAAEDLGKLVGELEASPLSEALKEARR